MNKYKILIVDDDPIILEDICTLIDWKKEGYDIMTAINGEQGLQKAISYNPDIVITDVRMPYLDGIDMIKEMIKAGISAKFLMLSAYGEFTYVREAMQLGVCDYILKPELSQILLLEKLIKIRDMQEGKEKEFKSANWEQTLRYSPIINNVITYINEHYSESAMKNADIAEAVELSVGRLCVRFKDEVGITLSEYITECRISNAKRLLLDGSYKVYEVAMMVGFGNSTYFSSVFRDKTGVPPIQYCGGENKNEI